MRRRSSAARSWASSSGACRWWKNRRCGCCWEMFVRPITGKCMNALLVFLISFVRDAIARFVITDRQDVSTKSQHGDRCLLAFFFRGHLQTSIRIARVAEADFLRLVRLHAWRDHDAIGLVDDLAHVRED